MKYLEKIIGQIILRTNAYMEATGRADSFERFPYLAVFSENAAAWQSASSGNLGPDETTGLSHPTQREKMQRARYEAFLDKLCCDGEDPVLITAAALALAATLVTEFAAYLNYYTGNRATLQLAHEMCGERCPDYAKIKKQWEMLRRVFLVETKSPLGYANIEADHELLSYLSGEYAWKDTFDEMGGRFCHRDALHPMYVREQLAVMGEGLLAKNNTILHIYGSGGKRFLAKHIAKRMEKDILFVGTKQVCGEENKEDALMRTLRRAYLNSCIVCIWEQSQNPAAREEPERVDDLLHAASVLADAGIPVILCTEKAAGISVACDTEGTADISAACDTEVTTENTTARHAKEAAGIALTGVRKIVRMELTPLSREERALVWQGFAEQYHLKEDMEQYSVRYRLNASEIARVVAQWESGYGNAQRASRCMGAEHGITEASGGETEQFSDICYRILYTEETQKLGTVIRPRVGFLDLIVPEQTRQILGEICCGAAQGYRIYEEWGLDKRFPYGKNISVLLAGAPGTGKTMTAHVLAHEIGVPLYQIDLSHIMDKYIGETEKHLEQVFEFAAKTNMVLFFDEADALFAKRGEVTEGKDRYANMEVSYLLQRMEQFDGVVILATNFYHHIDKAFLRRIKYVLKYQEPDAVMRKKIWESCLVLSLPRETIDTGYLARQFALSGGEIKNVMQSACICAVYEGRTLNMAHVLRAIRMEYEKLERNITPEFWGEYGYLME